MQEIYKVYINGRLARLFDEKEDAIKYARAFPELMSIGDSVYVVHDTSEIILEIRKKGVYEQ